MGKPYLKAGSVVKESPRTRRDAESDANRTSTANDGLLGREQLMGEISPPTTTAPTREESKMYMPVRMAGFVSG